VWHTGQIQIFGRQVKPPAIASSLISRKILVSCRAGPVTRRLCRRRGNRHRKRAPTGARPPPRRDRNRGRASPDPAHDDRLGVHPHASMTAAKSASRKPNRCAAAQYAGHRPWPHAIQAGHPRPPLCQPSSLSGNAPASSAMSSTMRQMRRSRTSRAADPAATPAYLDKMKSQPSGPTPRPHQVRLRHPQGRGGFPDPQRNNGLTRA